LLVATSPDTHTNHDLPGRSHLRAIALLFIH
jgi:hypothetical protein